MNTRERFRLWRLKRRARAIVRVMHEREDAYDCGFALRDFISGGRDRKLQRELDDIFVEIRKLDPSAPA